LLRRGREVEGLNRNQVSLGTEKLRRAGAEVGVCRRTATEATQ
jgi:hypothetical protein